MSYRQSPNMTASVYAKSPNLGRSGPLKYLGALLLKYLPTNPGIGPFESMITKGRPRAVK
jgi:hypothetical protein